MAAVVKVAEAKAHLSDLLPRVERGEELVIARGERPVARLVPLEEKPRGNAVIEAILALRDSGRIKPVTQAESRAWIDEGRK